MRWAGRRPLGVSALSAFFALGVDSEQCDRPRARLSGPLVPGPVAAQAGGTRAVCPVRPRGDPPDGWRRDRLRRRSHRALDPEAVGSLAGPGCPEHQPSRGRAACDPTWRLAYLDRRADRGDADRVSARSTGPTVGRRRSPVNTHGRLEAAVSTCPRGLSPAYPRRHRSRGLGASPGVWSDCAGSVVPSDKRPRAGWRWPAGQGRLSGVPRRWALIRARVARFPSWTSPVRVRSPALWKLLPRFDFGRGGGFRFDGSHSASNVPSNRRPHEAEPLEPIAEPLEVLLDPELHDLGPVPHVAQMGVDAAHHVLRPVAELARDAVKAHRRPEVERLQARRAVGVTEGLRPCGRRATSSGSRMVAVTD